MTMNRSLTVAAVAAFTAFQTAMLPAAPEKACTTAEPRTVMNLVNFLRGCEPRCKRDLVTPIVEQIKLNTRYGFDNTILLQYDAMLRKDLMDAVAAADKEKTEFGVWIEIVRPLCEKVGIPWRGRNGWDWDWFVMPGFLESYTVEQRALLIDELFRLFREKFGYYPKSAGSWIFDAWSLAYMKEKYGIVAACICREQDVTDAYGLRGGYSNGAYYPSKKNGLSAAVDMKNGIRLPVFRMLTPDPIYNYGYKYDFIDSRTGKKRRHVVTLEPAALGKVPYMVDWYFRAYTEPRGFLNLSYMQTGQENSFGWKDFGVDIGYPAQLETLKRYADQGLISVEKLCDSGRRFMARHKENCAQTQVALDDWMGKGRRSVWYNCRHYRANLYQDAGRFYIRDLRKMCDDFAEDYLLKPNPNWNENKFTPPVIDSYLFSTNDANGMLAFSGEACGMMPKATGPNELEVVCTFADGLTATVRFDEKGLSVLGTPLEVRMSPEWRAQHRFAPGRIDLKFMGFSYSVGVKGDLTPVADGYKIAPENGEIRFDMSL